jgi:hypothetical protein
MLQLAEKGMATRRNRTYRSAALFRAHDEREAQRLLDGGLTAVGLSAKELEGSFGKFAFRTDGSETELDCPEIGDVQRSKRESTSSPIPCTETEIDGCLKRISPICQDLLTDPYVMYYPRSIFPSRSSPTHTKGMD